MVLAAVNQLNCSYLGVEKVVNEPIVVGRSMGDFFGHLTSLSDKYFGGSEDGILKDFTPKAIEKAQNIMKDRITNEVPKKGKTKIGL